MNITLLVATALVLALAPSVYAAPAQSLSEPTAPEIWMCTGRALDLIEEGASWDFVRKRIAGIKLYIDKVKAAPAGDLAKLAKLLRDNQIQVAIECGGTLGLNPLDDTVGERSAKIELRKIDRWYAAGGKVDYLDLDGPVRRLLYPGPPRKRRKGWTSIERCASELMDYLRAVKKAHPEIRFFLLTNFPNWGYCGDVSYHARGPKRQDWGEYHDVVTTVLETAKKEGLEFAGVTVDNPYEYLVGQHFSVKLKDPTQVDWLGRVRAYEDFARSQGLEFNLIVNSEAGGKASDQAFYDGTLKMVEIYRGAVGRPTRLIVQSWYRFPQTIVPDSAPYSMTGLVRAVMTKTHGEEH